MPLPLPARVVAASLAALLATSGALPARAGDSGTALAESLFRDGKRLTKEGKFADACPKLEESQRIEPKLGTLMWLAACHAGQGKTASAWAEYTEAASQAAHAGRNAEAETARKQMAELEPKLARLVIRADKAPAGFEISLDGTKLGAGAIGSALPVDPGSHTLVATAPGRKEWTKTVDVAAGPSKQTLDVPELAPIETTEAKPTPAPEKPTLAVDAAPSSGPSPWGFVLGGVAIAGVGVGSYFGLRAMARNKDAEELCPGGQCHGQGLELDAQARSSATVSTISFAVAGAAAIGAVIVFATGGKSASSVQVGVAPGGLSLAGRF